MAALDDTDSSLRVVARAPPSEDRTYRAMVVIGTLIIVVAGLVTAHRLRRSHRAVVELPTIHQNVDNLASDELTWDDDLNFPATSVRRN